jgi:hypothetical protein
MEENHMIHTSRETLDRCLRGALVAAFCGVLAATSPLAQPIPGKAEPITEQDAHAIGVQAYVYLYSLVTMDLTRKQLTNVERVEGINAPMNTFANVPAFRRRR